MGLILASIISFLLPYNNYIIGIVIKNFIIRMWQEDIMIAIILRKFNNNGYSESLYS